MKCNAQKRKKHPSISPFPDSVKHPHAPQASPTQMKSNSNALLTAKQLAELLQVTPRTVYDLAREEKIPHLRLGRNLRFKLERVLETLEIQARITEVDICKTETLAKIKRGRDERPKELALAPYSWSKKRSDQ